MGSPTIRFKNYTLTCDICGNEMSDGDASFDEDGDIIFECCKETEVNFLDKYDFDETKYDTSINGDVIYLFNEDDAGERENLEIIRYTNEEVRELLSECASIDLGFDEGVYEFLKKLKNKHNTNTVFETNGYFTFSERACGTDNLKFLFNNKSINIDYFEIYINKIYIEAKYSDGEDIIHERYF